MGKPSRMWPVAAVLMLSASACGQGSQAEGGSQGQRTAPAGAGEQVRAKDFASSRFGDSTDIDHRWYPLPAGKRLDYRGSSLEDGKRLHHAVTFIVTDLTKVVDGVKVRVIWERDYTDGDLVETELAMFAQDKDGNIWHLGQYPEELEGGKIVATPAWVHGVKGASAGVTIPAHPTVGNPAFAQGFAPPPINWVDHGRVHKTGQRTCVPEGCYSDVVVVEEFETGLPQAFQDKFYAPGVGVVRVGWRGKNDESKEVLELVDARMLTAKEMAEARVGALAQEDRAYRLSKNVWGTTPRSELARE